MPGKYAVIGLGRFGSPLARALSAAGAEVIAIDRDGRLVEEVRDYVALAVRLNSTDADALREQGVGDVDVAIVGIGQDFESAALTVATLKQLGHMRIVARAQTEIQGRILRLVGADEIASPEQEAAQRWAHRLTLPNLERYIELDERHSMVYVKAPGRFRNHTLQNLDLRNAYGVNLIAIERSDPPEVDSEPGQPPQLPRKTLEVPGGSTQLRADDVLILVGTNENLSRLPRD